MLSDDRLAEIAAAAAAATPGPWADCVFAEGYATAPDERGVHCPEADETYQKPDGTWHTLHICRGMTGPNRVANSQFIACARQAVPDLLAERAALLARIAELEAGVRAPTDDDLPGTVLGYARIVYGGHSQPHTPDNVADE